MFTPEPTTPQAAPVEQIDLAPSQENTDQIDLDSPSAAQIPDAKTAEERALKAHMAFGNESPGIHQLANELLVGNERAMRERLALGKDIALRQIKMDAIQGVAAEKAKKGEALTQDDAEFIAGLSREQLQHDPATILESEFARQYFNQQTLLNDGKNPITKGLSQDPEATHEELDIASNIKTRQEIVKTKIQDLNRKWEATGWGSAIASHLSRFIPLLENIRLHDSKGDSILPGANLDERRQRLWALPPAQFAQRFNQDVEELEKLNPLTAMKYATAVLSFSASDRFTDNAFGLLDASTIPVVGTAKLLAKGVRAGVKALGERGLAKANEQILKGRQEVKQALKDSTKADSNPTMNPVEDILAGAGDVESSASVLAAKDAQAAFRGQDPLAQGNRLRSEIPSLFNVDRMMDGSKNLEREAASRLRDTLADNAAALSNAVSQTGRVIHLEEGSDALRIGLEKSWEQLRNTYSHLGDAVIDVGHIRAEDTLVNTHIAELKVGKRPSKTEDPAIIAPANSGIEISMGKPDATLFTGERAPQEAEFWARDIYKLNPGEYKILQQGNGHYISLFKPVDETDSAVRDALISTKHQTPVGFWNTMLGRGRTPEDTLSEGNREMRHVATHGPQELHRFAKQVADHIGDLPNKSKERILSMLQYNRDFTYKEGDQIRYGMFYKDVGEFDLAWSQRFKKDPTEQERIAYFSAVQLNDWDWVFRNLRIYRDKARQGIERFSFSHQITDETSGETAMVRTNYFDGKIRKDLPFNETEDFGILVYDGKTNTKKYVRKSTATAEERADIESKLAVDGYKIVQVANPVDNTARKLVQGEDTVHFVVVPEVTRKPLDWKQLNYRPGGHKEYQYENWVKQPVMRKVGDRMVYEGDQAIFNQATEAEARKFALGMDTARMMLKDGKIDDLEKFLPANLPYSLSEFTKLFSETLMKDGTKVPPRLSLTDPIRHTTSGQNVFDIHKDLEKLYPKFENEIRSSYNLYSQIDKKFTSERDATLGTVREQMGLGQPLFQLEPSKLIDPLNTLNRGMANVMRTRFLNEYKLSSVERFIQEFGDLIRIEGKTGQEALDELRKNPVFYLHNAEFHTQHPDKARLAAARNVQRSVLSLIGTESELGQNLGWAQRKLMDFIYEKAGQGSGNWVADHMLPVVQDPFRYARAVAFHSKLGLFNPVQLFLQMQTMTHIAAVAGPINATRGVAASTLMRMLSLTENPKVIEAFAEKAAALGWKKADFLESYQAMKKSGIFNVEGEVAIRDDVFDPKIFNGAGVKFLDKGTFFFREGERMTRLTAWNAAYLEWKKLNPGKALDNKALSEILLRQNTLSVNMTRASSAWWQQGLMSVPTQFFAYQARLMEQFLGKRLTPMEKARAFMTYSAMYGVPTAVGATTFAWPWYDDVRQAALERGYDVDAPGMRALIEGIPSTMFTMITGNEQNFAQRLGPGGVQYFKDVFSKGKVLDAFGASPKIIGSMVSAISPVFKGIISPFVPGMADWKMTTADAITALEEISTINNIGKAIYAWNTGKYISKNEINLGPATTADALMGAMMGTTPLKITDAFIMGEMATEQARMQDAVKKEIVKNWRRAMREFDNGNDSAAEAHLQNMRNQIVGGGFRPDQLPQILSEASKGHESFLDKMNEKYWRSAPNDQYQQRFNRMFKIKE